MAKVKKQRKSESHRSRVNPYQLSPCILKVSKDMRPKKKCSKAAEKKDWEDATCSVCMESPHNAVLLLCSSYNKGCRPYMCATSHRLSNCLEQYKKAYTKVTPTHNLQQLNGFMDKLRLSEKMEVAELLCPLCRGQVKGWTVVESARKYFNAKKRNCMQDKCSFLGSYKKLRKHVRKKHPLARPRALDPNLEEKWKRLECERERNDVISTIISSTPGAVVLGDYVLEPNQSGFYGDFDSDVDDYMGDDDDNDDDRFFSLEPFDLGGYSYSRYSRNYNSMYGDMFGSFRSAGTGSTAAMGRGFRRIVFQSSRRHRLRGSTRHR